MQRLLLFSVLASTALAQDPFLPPVAPWDGASRRLVLGPDEDWVTPCERSGLLRTPRYAETVAWLQRLCAASDDLKMVSLGKSHEGRDIWMVVAAREPVAGKPVLLAQAGIHAGEIDGKDAGMMLLRDMTVRGSKTTLLDKAVFLFIPILSVDGHERFGPHGRPNQRGPLESGWRTNARNLNLNRDYAKLDTPGVRAALKAIREWSPDLYLDIHVTDGADYQYDITWGYNGPHAHSPEIAAWLSKVFDPPIRMRLEGEGHVPGPLVFAVDPTDMAKGNRAPTFGARYSHGYGDWRHLPSILVENHSLKPYDQRVLGTYVFLEGALRVVGAFGESLRKAIADDRALRRETVPLTFKAAEEGEARLVPFLGIGQKLVDSPVSGGKRVIWTGEPIQLEIPLIEHDRPDIVVKRPKAYWIPPGWPEVVERLALHGIAFEILEGSAREVECDMYRIKSHELAKKPFEGRVRVSGEVEVEPHRMTYPPGSVRVRTDQPLGDLAIALLEPQSPDSFFQWGFFHSVLQRTEYIEGYVIEPMAERMLQDDPELETAFEKKLAEDEAFRKDPKARLDWFFQKTRHYDARFRLYPIGRE